MDTTAKKGILVGLHISFFLEVLLRQNTQNVQKNAITCEFLW